KEIGPVSVYGGLHETMYGGGKEDLLSKWPAECKTFQVRYDQDVNDLFEKYKLSLTFHVRIETAKGKFFFSDTTSYLNGFSDNLGSDSLKDFDISFDSLETPGIRMPIPKDGSKMGDGRIFMVYSPYQKKIVPRLLRARMEIDERGCPYIHFFLEDLK
ncbi:MAG: hypothetical protein ABIQ57_12325, partial [Candidatus Kapaibacterium sp.]